MLRCCFVCKITCKVKPIGIKKMGCKEIYICEKCDQEMTALEYKPVSVKPIFYESIKYTKTIH